MKQIDVIVAGAGIWGCTMARVLAEAGRRVLVLERRTAPGGNVHCETDPETGIEIHTYGSHIFHTHLDDVWDFVRRFTEFNGYQHKVLARHAGRTYFLPLGLTLVNQFYGLDLTPAELPAFIASEISKTQHQPSTPSNTQTFKLSNTQTFKLSNTQTFKPSNTQTFKPSNFQTFKPSNFEEQAISFIGRPLYEAFISGYTRKQWGTDPRNLPASIIRRLPVRASYDVNYYSDTRQGIPLNGYNSLIVALLDHPSISLELNTDWLSWRETPAGSALAHLPVFYSGPIDALFGYRFGPLPWRSLRFERERVAVQDFQGTSVVNYTDADVPYTRIHEFKHYHPEDAAVMSAPSTIICREYPLTWKPGDEPYYPVDVPAARELLALYQAEAAKNPRVVVGGRLGAYKYFDMDRSIGNALETARSFLRENP